MTETDEYMIYRRCKVCGQILTDFEIEDNDGLCDYCKNENMAWIICPFGENI